MSLLLGPIGVIIHFSALAYWVLQNTVADDLTSDHCCETKIAVAYTGECNGHYSWKMKNLHFRDEFRRINSAIVL